MKKEEHSSAILLRQRIQLVSVVYVLFRPFLSQNFATKLVPQFPHIKCVNYKRMCIIINIH